VCAWASPAAATTAAGLPDADRAGPAICRVDTRGNELTVDVRGTPLADVLRAIGERASIDVTLRGDFSAPVTASFAGVPLEEGIRRLVPGHSLVVTYAGSSGTPGANAVTGIVVVSGSAGSPAPMSVERERPTPGGNGDTSVAAPATNAPLTGWVDDIRALTGEADLGSRAALARLTEISASEPAGAVREQAVAAIGRLAGVDIEPALTAALADADASVRLRAVRGLRRTGTETAVASLARAATDDPDPEVRLAALSALTSFPGPAMVQGLVRAMADPDGRVRDAAARGLTWWNARRSAAP